MDFGSGPIFAGLSERLKFLSARTNVLAENVANSDTPGFVARDVEAPSATSRQGATASSASVLRTSNARHIEGRAVGQSSDFKVTSAPDGEASLTGNRVSLETQMLKLSGTRMEYQMASTVYRKAVDMMRLAARGGR